MDDRLYFNPRCSKCRQALALLQQRGVDVPIVEYQEQPPDAAELAELQRLLGVPAADMLRRGEALNTGLNPPDDAPDRELLELIAAHPVLLQRPILVYRGRAVIARPPERLLELL